MNFKGPRFSIGIIGDKTEVGGQVRVKKVRASRGVQGHAPWEILKIYNSWNCIYPPFSEHFYRQKESKLVA